MTKASTLRSNADTSKTALVLAGGGLIGAVYEAGALYAINEMLVGHTVNDFGIYVGTSAGALVASMLANGMTPQDLLRVLDNSYPGLRALTVRDVFRTNLSEFLFRIHHLPSALLKTGRHILRHLHETAFVDLIWELSAIFPSGLYDTNAIESYIAAILNQAGGTDRFEQLAQKLLIVATELDSGKRTVFGSGYQVDVSISRAVTASSAVPLLYRPVRIGSKDYVDGVLNGVASVDLAIESGAKLVICINSLVSLNASTHVQSAVHIRRQGLQAVANQAIRTLVHTGLLYHIKNLRAKYPDVDIILIEPRQDDARIFSHSPMGYGNRQLMAQHGYETVAHGLAANIEYIKPILSRHGIRFAPKRLSHTLSFKEIVSQECNNEAAPGPSEIQGNRQGDTQGDILSALAASLAVLEARLDQRQDMANARQPSTASHA